jgi:hypothetical protein
MAAECVCPASDGASITGAIVSVIFSLGRIPHRPLLRPAIGPWILRG